MGQRDRLVNDLHQVICLQKIPGSDHDNGLRELRGVPGLQANFNVWTDADEFIGIGAKHQTKPGMQTRRLFRPHSPGEQVTSRGVDSRSFLRGPLLISGIRNFERQRALRGSQRAKNGNQEQETQQRVQAAPGAGFSSGSRLGPYSVLENAVPGLHLSTWVAAYRAGVARQSHRGNAGPNKLTMQK